MPYIISETNSFELCLGEHLSYWLNAHSTTGSCLVYPVQLFFLRLRLICKAVASDFYHITRIVTFLATCFFYATRDHRQSSPAASRTASDCHESRVTAFKTAVDSCNYLFELSRSKEAIYQLVLQSLLVGLTCLLCAVPARLHSVT